MAEQAEAGDVGDRPGAGLARQLRGLRVETHHARGGRGHLVGGRLVVLERGGDDAGTERLRQQQPIAGPCAALALELVGVERADHHQAVLGLAVAHRVAAGDRDAGLARLLGAAAQDLARDLHRQGVGQRRDVEGQQRPRAHRVDVAQAVGGGDGAVGVGVVDDRGEEVDRHHQRQLVAQPVDRGVVRALQPHQEVRVGTSGLFDEWTQDLLQDAGGQLAGSAGAGGEARQADALAIAHGADSSLRFSPILYCDAVSA